MKPSESELFDAAEEYVFDKNGNKFSNNNDEAGDNFASFLAGANWATDKHSQLMNNLPEIEKISVMNLKPDDILVFSTDFKIPSNAYSRIDQKITDWKIQNNITNKHLILSSLKLEVLSKEQAAKFKDKQ